MKVDHICDVIQADVAAGEAERMDIDRYISWYLSEFWDQDGAQARIPDVARQSDESDITMESNYPYAYIDTMIANICPQNPQVTIEARKPGLEDKAKNREKLACDEMRRDKLHAKGWDLATWTAISGRGPTKTIWDARSRRPKTRIVDPRRFFFDKDHDWEDCLYAFEATLVTREEFALRMKKGKRGGAAYDKEVAAKAIRGFTQIPEWLANANDLRRAEYGSEPFQWTVIYEFYDFQAGRYYHMLEGEKKPLLAGPLPYRYVRNPFELVTFNKNLRDSRGLSDIKLVAPLLRHLNELDSLELLFAYSCIPIMIVNEQELDAPEEFVEALRGCVGPGAIARLKAAGGRRIEDIVSYTATPTIGPSWDKMRQRLVQLIEFVLGIPQYSRGVVGVADVATELALADTATRTRNGRRIRILEDWISSVAKKYIGLWKEMMQPDERIPVRDASARRSDFLDADALGFPIGDAEDFEEEWHYDFVAVPYSPTENHKIVQLQKLQQFMQVLANNPAVDQGKLVTKLLELLGMSGLRTDAQPMMTVQPGGAYNMPRGAMPSGTSADSLATGGMPEGTSVEALETPNPASGVSMPRASIPSA